MADLAIQTVTVDGLTPGYVPASTGGDTARIGHGNTLEVRNTDAGASRAVTLAVPWGVPTGGPFPDKVYTVPAGGDLRVPLLRAYSDPTDGRAHITYDNADGLSIAVTRAED